MTYPEVQLVAAPTASAATLFNFNDGEATVYRQADDDFDFGVPELLGDPGAVDPMYGPRQIEFTFSLRGTKPQAAALLSSLARELLGGPGWLRYRQTATSDILFFRVLRSRPGPLSLQYVKDDAPATRSEWWSTAVQLPCEPFARGEWVTVPAVTISNDPAAAANPCRAILPAIAGDAPAPLRISVNPSNANPMPGYRWMIGLHSGATARTPIVWQIGGADGWAAGADTGPSVSAAGYSGGSYRQVSFSTKTTLETRISGTAPEALKPGRYKVLVRCDRTDNASVFSLRFGVFGLSKRPAVVTNRTTTAAASHATWVDLGDFPMPPFAPPAGEDPGLDFPPIINLDVGRLSGTGSLRLDAIMLVPLATRDSKSASVLFTEFPGFGIEPGAGRCVWDSDQSAVWGYNAGGYAAAMETWVQGRYPVAIPGATNVLTLLQQVNAVRPFFGEDASDSIAASTSVEVSYQPRWLYLGDS